MREVIFIVFFSLTIIFGALSVLHRNIIYNALSLIATIFSVSVLVMLLGHEFLALSLILIYIGAIAVTIVFAVMMTPVHAIPKKALSIARVILAAFSSMVFFAGIYYTLNRSAWPPSVLSKWKELPRSSLKELGRALTSEYALPFEVISIVLLVAIIGTIILARRRGDIE